MTLHEILEVSYYLMTYDMGDACALLYNIPFNELACLVYFITLPYLLLITCSLLLL